MTDARKPKKRTTRSGRTSVQKGSRKKFAIDFHAHIVFPEAAKFARKHVVSVNLPKEVLSNPVLLRSATGGSTAIIEINPTPGSICQSHRASTCAIFTTTAAFIISICWSFW